MRTDSDEYQIIWLIRRLFRALAQRSNESLQDLDVSAADRAVLEFLYPREQLSVPEIAERYQVSRQHVQTTVNRLIDIGLIAARDNPRHKRSPLMSLTKSGASLFRKISKQDLEIIHSLFQQIPKEDRQATRRTLESLLEKLK